VYVVTLLLLLGFVGMSAGILISTVSVQESDAIQLALGSFFPCFLLSGIIWPSEAVPVWLNWLSYSLPTTWTAEAMRSVVIRGWYIGWKRVWMGYIISLTWFIVLFSLASMNLSAREKRIRCCKPKPKLLDSSLLKA